MEDEEGVVALNMDLFWKCEACGKYKRPVEGKPLEIMWLLCQRVCCDCAIKIDKLDVTEMIKRTDRRA